MRLAYGRQVCGALAESSIREWLVVDAAGGYAMGTVAGLRTRRYHGLLTVSGPTVAERRLLLAALDLVVVVGDHRVELTVHEWADAASTVAPRGDRLLATFDVRDGVPRWRWDLGDVAIEREIAMAPRTVAVVHRVIRSGVRPVRLEATALCTDRDAHATQSAGVAPAVRAVADGAVVGDAVRLRGPGWQPIGVWYRAARLREEVARGFDGVEDLWCAGRFAVDGLRSGGELAVTAWSRPLDVDPPDAETIVAESRARARSAATAAGASDDVDRLLVHACDQVVVTAADGPAVVAGYPWFGEWGRDTFISYAGLFLATGRFDEGRSLLTRYGAGLDRGMVPNTADGGSLEYNTSDASLWFVQAIARHVEQTGDLDLAAALDPAVRSVIEHHLGCTRHGIGADADGLLAQGEDGLALTWMDARVDGRSITPRQGKPVEIAALWIAALAYANRRSGGRWAAIERSARSSFARRFVRGDGLGLLDVVDGPDGDDASIRANQLIAVAVPDGPLTVPAGGPPSGRAIASAVLRVVSQRLLTSLGVRTLDPSDPRFAPAHRGDRVTRDEAYHQGTVWPWLIGPYVDAALGAGEPIDADALLDGLTLHLADDGVGGVSETADGAAPHRTSGCPFQAWSAAELLRIRRRLGRT